MQPVLLWFAGESAAPIVQFATTSLLTLKVLVLEPANAGPLNERAAATARRIRVFTGLSWDE